MAFTPVAAASGTGSPQYPYSTPFRAEISITDDGGGGQLFINAGGLNGANQLDLSLFFGTSLFRSTALRAAMKRSPQAVTADLNLIFRDIEVNIVGRDSAAAAAAPSYLPVVISGVGGFNVVGPAAAGTWRVTVELRQSSRV